MLGWKRTSGTRKLGSGVSPALTKGFKNLPLVANGEDLSIRELVAALDGSRTHSGIEFFLKVIRDVAQLLLDIPDDFSLSGGSE